MKKSSILPFIFLAVCGGMSVGIAHIAIILYAVYLGANASEIGFIGGAQGIGVLAMALPVGFFIDHFGARTIYVLGGVLGALIYMLMPLIHTPQFLFAAVIVSGLFMAFRLISMNSIFFDYLKIIGSERGGWYRGSHSIGMVFLGPIIGGFIIKYAGYKGAFLAAGLSFLATVVVARIALTGKIKEEGAVFSFDSLFSQIKALIKNKDLVEASVIEGVSIIASSCFNTFIVVIVLRAFHMSKDVAALFLSVQGIVIVISLFSLDILLRRIGARSFYLSGISIIMFGLFILGVAPNLLWLWGGAVVLGVGLGMLTIVNVSRVAGTGSKKGKIAGYFSLFTMTGGIVGPVLGGFIGGIFGLQAIFWFLIPLFFVLGFKINNSFLKRGALNEVVRYSQTKNL